MAINQVLEGDCLELLRALPDDSVGMFLCDLPYGCTACHWDKRIELDALWEQIRRLLQPRRAAVFTATQPFTTDLICSNRDWFRYSWVWEKSMPVGGYAANSRPLSAHEDVLVFGNGSLLYQPQRLPGKGYKRPEGKKENSVYGSRDGGFMTIVESGRFPKTVLKLPNPNHGSIHPTQKPVALFEYLIRTYTNPGDIVVDPTAGSMTTAIAAMNTGRGYICMEKDPEEYRKGLQRVEEYLSAPRQIDLLEPALQLPTEVAKAPEPPQLSLFDLAG